MNVAHLLRIRGAQNRSVGYDVLVQLRRRARRQRTIRIWAGRLVYLLSYLALTGIVVALMMVLGG